MNLFDIRKQVVGISGRYDLVVDSIDYVDNGMNFYIQEGQRYLERKLGVTPTTAKLYQVVTAGNFLVKFRNCRSIRNVWIIDADSRTKVKCVTDEEMKSLFPRYADNIYMSTPTLVQAGRPLYYCPTNLRRSPDDEGKVDDQPSLSSYLDTVSPSDPEINGLVMMPSTDKTYTVEVTGLFYDAQLVSDSESNYWSMNYPMLLVRAALRELYANYAGSKLLADLEGIIASDLLGIELDTIDQEIAEITEMEG